MAYHKREIPKGVYGEFSKIAEEWEELLDAHEQDGKILELVELSDLVGAIEGYALKQFNMSLKDIVKMMKMTKEAFEEGKRK